ncbi:CPBP family intramembrane metalloprotease [Flavihumibacter sp. R14]|nr:CPBP family intramembrane metalloprotease [Flavihumibacter soli]
MLRNYLPQTLRFDYKLGLTLILLFGLIRFLVVLNATITSDYSKVSLIFVAMVLLPFLLLNRNGRREIGICKPASYKWLGISFLLGAGACFLVYWIGMLLFQKTGSNWFYAIGNTYPVNPASLQEGDKLIYFIIYAIIGMTFSPIGEELFYRGMVHESLRSKFGEVKASVIDSAAFGITHLAHFGLIYSLGQWSLLPLPAVLWIILMFASGLTFGYCKRKTGSIWGAVISHAGFNLAMTYFIFYELMS